jgi:hypothetical protein
MSVKKLCEKYGFISEDIIHHIKIKSKFDVWYIEKGLDYSKKEIDLYHENPINRQEFRKRITDRNNFNINQNCIWHKQVDYKMTLEEVFEYISGHDKKYFS